MKKNYIEYLFLLLLGALSSLSLPPFNFLIINFLSFSFFFIFLIKKYKENLKRNKKFFFYYGWLFGFGYFISNLYWISISLTFDESFKFLIPFSVILIPCFLSIFYGLITYLFIIFKPNKILTSFLTFVLIFGLIEYVRGSILTGFPWNLIAYSFSNQIEILYITSIIGTYTFNLFCISLFTSPAILILKESRKDLIVPFFFLITTLFFYFYGFLNIQKFDEIELKKNDYKLRVIGSNISLERFYNDLDPVSVIEELIEISQPLKNEKIIFIWPEGILPGISQKQLIEYNWLFNEKFNDNHLLIVGINNLSNVDEKIKYFNSFSVFDHNLNLINSYNKIKLVPFGEFLPFEKILKYVGFKTITNNYQSYSKGEIRNIIDISQNKFSLKILPLICYEIIYSGKLFDNPNFDIIINISEDGWFGKSIGPQQHFVHSIYRAIESGKYVLRSSNNGLTAIINPIGEVEKQVRFNESGYIDFSELRNVSPTLFSKYGNKIFGIIILLYIFLIFSFKRIKK